MAHKMSLQAVFVTWKKSDQILKNVGCLFLMGSNHWTRADVNKIYAIYMVY